MCPGYDVGLMCVLVHDVDVVGMGGGWCLLLCMESNYCKGIRGGCTTNAMNFGRGAL